MRELLAETAERSADYLESLAHRKVYPDNQALENLAGFEGPLPEGPTEPGLVLELLDTLGSPATVASAGGRYFGFVTGGSLPAPLAANWLAGAWDQNAGPYLSSPVGAFLEDLAIRWLVEALNLPVGTGGGLVTGATLANFSALAAARSALLAREGWDVEAQGLYGAPEIQVIVGQEVHVSVLKALAMLGLGQERVIRVPVDGQGRMFLPRWPQIGPRTIICTQAGNVNTGSFDPLTEICEIAGSSQAWVHVDGAFGLWAAADPARAALIAGFEGADSWATDAHKWLNVPYDCGIVFCKRPEMLRAAMTGSAAYLLQEEDRREPMNYTPELSRRARGIEVWAALKSLGRSGLAELIGRTCDLAVRFSDGMQSSGFEVLNEVCLNQVLVSFGEPRVTREMTARIQQEGTCWAGGTEWQGRTAMRFSVSSWATTEEDIDLSIAAIQNIARDVMG